MNVAAEEMDRLGLSAEERAVLEDGAPAQKEAAPIAAADSPVEELEPIVAYSAPAVPDYDDRVRELDERTNAAAERFKTGDLTFDEFRAEERAVDEERRQLDADRLKHEISAGMQDQAAQQRWKYECGRFFREIANAEGVDYKGKPVLWAALDAEVKRLAALEENADKPGLWFLQQAHGNVRALREHFDEASGSATGDRRSIADLDSLSGLEQEAELARLSPEEADAWLRGR